MDMWFTRFLKFNTYNIMFCFFNEPSSMISLKNTSLYNGFCCECAWLNCELSVMLKLMSHLLIKLCIAKFIDKRK